MKFIPKDQAAADFQAYLGSDFVEFLQTNPLPDSYEVKLDGRSAETGRCRPLEKQVMSWDGVDEVVYQRNEIEQVTSNINKFNLVLLLFGGALLIISLILLNNTIRVTIFSKRYLIHTMKLVGGHALVYYEAVPGRQYLAGNLCRADLVGDAGRDDRRAARRAAGGEVRFRISCNCCSFRGDDGGGYPHFAGVHRFRRS